MKKLFFLKTFIFILLFYGSVYSQTQEEWLIGKNKIKFLTNGQPPVVESINQEYFSKNSIKLNSVNYSVVENGIIGISNQSIKMVNHTNFNELNFGPYLAYKLKKTLLLTDNLNGKFFLLQKGYEPTVDTYNPQPYNFYLPAYFNIGNYKMNYEFESDYQNNNSNFYYFDQYSDGFGFNDQFSSFGHAKNVNPLSTKYNRDYIIYSKFSKENNLAKLTISSKEISNGSGMSDNHFNFNFASNIFNNDERNKFNEISRMNIDEAALISHVFTDIKVSKNLKKIGLLMIFNSNLNEPFAREDIEIINQNTYMNSYLFVFDFDPETNTISNMVLQNNLTNIFDFSSGTNFIRDFEFSDDGNLLYYIAQRNRIANENTSRFIHSVLKVKNLSTGSNKKVTFLNPTIGNNIFNKLHKDPFGNIIVFSRPIQSISNNTSKFYKLNNPLDYNNVSYSYYFELATETERTKQGAFMLPQYYPKEAIYSKYAEDINIDKLAVLYPNPNNGIFNIQTETEIKSVEIFNQLSRLVYSNEKVFSKELNVDISRADNGFYVTKINYSNGTTEDVKFVIRK